MNGCISINKVHVNGAPSAERKNDYITISLEDITSTCEFVTLKLSLTNFALALTGQSLIPMEFEVAGLENIGKTFQHKYINLPLIFKASKEQIDLLISKHEIDGWIGERTNYTNYHYWNRDNSEHQTVKILYHRWIEK